MTARNSEESEILPYLQATILDCYCFTDANKNIQVTWIRENEFCYTQQKQ